MSEVLNKELPENWAWATFGDVADLLRGVSYKKGDASSEPTPGKVPVLRANNIGYGLNFDGLVYVPEKQVKEEQYIKKGDIIIAMSSGSKHLVGKAAQANDDFNGAYGAFCANLRVRADIEPKYVAYFYSSQDNLKRISGSSKGSNINNLKREHILSAPIPIAPPEQQKRIVAKIEELFSHIDAGIEALKKAKQLLKQYRQSVLKAAVTGELTKEWREENSSSHASSWLNHISELRKSMIAEGVIAKPKKITAIGENDLPYHIPESWKWVRLDDFVLASVDCPHSTPRYKEHGKKCVRTADFLPGKLIMDNVRYVTLEAFDERNKRLVPQPDDVLYSREGGILGVACMIPEGEEVCLGQRMMILRTESKLASTYLMHNLNSPLIVHRVKSLTGGSASPHLNVGEIRNFLLPIPPKQECEELLSELEGKLTSIKRLEREIDLHLVKAKKNKQSILASAFNGAID